MGKRILVLSSSARKRGNTNLLCAEFIRGAMEVGCDVEQVYLSGKNVKGCMGCLACQKNGGRCVQRDDMTEIYEKMLAADVIVFASPVYFYSFNAQMKAVMDRTFAIERIISGKKAYLITTGAAPEPKYMSLIVEHFNRYIGCFKGIEVAGIIIGCGTTEAGDIKGSATMQEAYEMGRNS